jgi:hypothetical protein
MYHAFYALTPLQQGMLFQVLSAPRAGVDVLQVDGALRGVDPARLRSAWSHAARRHEVLRTSFDWTDPGNPVQRVHSDFDFAFAQAQWRGVAEEARKAWLAEDWRLEWTCLRPLAGTPVPPRG